MSKQTFIQGTILLIAGMITRLLGFVNRIVLARLMGEEGVGLYMMAMPSLFLIITLTQIGLPIAIAKRVAEAESMNHHDRIKQILALSFIIIACTSTFFTITMIIFAPILANFLLTDERTLYPLLAMSGTIPFIALSSVIKGYFQGMQNMKPQSISMVIEQVTRTLSVIVLVTLLLPYGIEFAATGAVISIIVGEIASLIFLFRKFKKEKPFHFNRPLHAYVKNSRQIRKQLFAIALPNTGSRLISSFATFLEPILVSQSLAIAGVAVHAATSQYGELTGYVIPLLYLPTFITNSLSIALVPSISELAAKKNEQSVQKRLLQAVRISFASGALATIIFMLFSTSILTYMYGTSNASNYIVLMAPFFLFLYVQAPLQAALFALDLAKYAMWNSLLGSALKFFVLILLASNPTFGMMGVAIAISTSIVFITMLHLVVLYKTVRFLIPFSECMKMIILLVITYNVGYLLKQSPLYTSGSTTLFLILLFILTFFYLCTLILLRIVTKEEWRQLPLILKPVK